MVDPADLKHELVVSANTPLIRLYRSCWGEKATLDFCHLFWGTIFCWVPILAVMILAPIYYGLVLPTQRLKRRMSLRKQARIARQASRPPEPPKPEKPAKDRSWLLDKIVDGCVRFGVWWKYTLAPFWHAHLSAPLTIGAVTLLAIILGAGCIAGLAALGILLFNLSAYAWTIIGLSAACILTVIVAGLALTVFGRFVHTREYDEKVFYHAVKRPALSSFRILAIGYRAVKTNTCPRIVMAPDDD